MNASLLIEKLKDFEYYRNKLPMVLQQSAGFVEHFRIWYDLLIGLADNQNAQDPSIDLTNKLVWDSNFATNTWDNGEWVVPTTETKKGILPVADELLFLINIFDAEVIGTYSQISETMPDTIINNYADMLDNIGALFGISRHFTAEINHDTHATRVFNLNNADFLVLIKAQIIQNYCEGTIEQVVQYYNDIGLSVYINTVQDDAGFCKLYLLLPDGNYSLDIRDMFLAGMLRIASMGIRYEDIVEVTGYLMWDSFVVGNSWDNGKWKGAIV